jgi:multidrug efflux pump subunit AcrA (membrane-fusion protein)
MLPNDRRILPAAFLVLAVLIFGYLKSTRPEQKMAIPSERVWYVDTVTANPQKLAPSLTLYGQVETPDLVKAAAPKEGQVDRILVREGDAITAGQWLLSLDARDFEAVRIQKEAQVLELEAMIASEKNRHGADKKALQHEKLLLKLSGTAVGRAEKMKAKNLGSAAALDQAYQELERQKLLINERTLSLNDHQSRLKQLEARLKKAQADLEIAALDLQRSQIYAAFDGFVSEIKVATGDRVGENQHLMSMYPTDTLEVRALIPTPYQAELQHALSAGASLLARARYAEIPITLKLDRFSGAASSRGIDALFKIEDRGGLLRLGNTLALTLSRPARDNAVALPYAALYGRDKLYRLRDGRMESIHVDNLGDYVDGSGNTALLVSSPMITANDQIITTHLPNAVNGLRVEAGNMADLTEGLMLEADATDPEPRSQP